MGGEKMGHVFDPRHNLALRCRVTYIAPCGTFIDRRFASWAEADTFAAEMVIQGITVTVSATYKGFPRKVSTK